MTGYHIELGYNSSGPKDSEQLVITVLAVCAKPALILDEARRVEGIVVPEEYAESYRLPWKDSTIQIIQGERIQVMQLASGSGAERDYKEAMRRAFCRLVLEAMHRARMEVSVIVA